MQRNTRGTNRSILPIFGNRKRQRQAIFADSIDISTSNDDDMLIDNDISNEKSHHFSTQGSQHKTYINTYNNRCNMQSGTNFNKDMYHLNSSSANSAMESTNYTPSNHYQGKNNLTERNPNTFDNNLLNDSLSSSMFDDSFCGNSLLNSQANRGRNFQNKAVMNNSHNQSRDGHNQMNKSSTQRPSMNADSRNFSSQNQMRMNNNNSRNNNVTSQSGMMNPNKQRSGRPADQTCPLGMLPPPNKVHKVPTSKHSDGNRNRSFNQQQQQSSSNHCERGRTNQHTRNPPSSSASHTESRPPIQNTRGGSRGNNQLDAVVPQVKVEESSARNTTTVVKKQSNPAPRVITTNISKLDKWCQLQDESPKVFEICGNLSSAVTNNNNNTSSSEKMFTISDGTGEIRCLFWEIDRRLPQLSRGSTVRSVGRVNQGYFHCLCIRSVKPREVQLIKKLVEKSDKFLHTAHAVVGRTS